MKPLVQSQCRARDRIIPGLLREQEVRQLPLYLNP